MKTRAEILTEQFYSWEKRGRGWELWGYPVELEPTFVPFFGHFAPPQSLTPIDDARKPTLLSSLVEGIAGLFKPKQKSVEFGDLNALYEDIDPVPDLSVPNISEVVELLISIPPSYKTDRETVEQFTRSLAYAKFPVGFEIVALDSRIFVQYSCQRIDYPTLRDQLSACFPDAFVLETPGWLRGHWDTEVQRESVIVDFALSDESMLPIRSFRNFDTDPYVSLIGAFSDLRESECAVFQVLFQAVRSPWAENMLDAVSDYDGNAFFMDAPEVLSLTREKIAKPLFAAVVRVGVKSPVPDRAWRIMKSAAAALTQYDRPGSNRLVPLENNAYPDEVHELDLLYRRSHRYGFLINSEELVSLAHLPSSSVRSDKLYRDIVRTKAAPAIAVGHNLSVGINYHRGQTVEVTLSPEQRMKSTYVIGTPGTGKTTLLLNMIIQDMKNGDGLAVLDPHGDLFDQILDYVPEDRLTDVILFDPSDEAYPVGFNILSAHSDVEKNLLASDLTGVFRRLSTSWGDQMNTVLSNAILAFLESDRGGTLMDLRRFLVDKTFRLNFLQQVTDPEVAFYWKKEFPLLSGKPQAPVLTRLNDFLRPKQIRYMVAQKENRIKFGEIMNGRKIFLAKLAQGLIGEENSSLLGAFLVAKFHQTALGRQEISRAKRAPFYLYVDEFQNFVTPSMESLLSGGRKFNIGLTLANQEIQQLESKNRDVASSVLTNPYTRICFGVGDADAKKLANGFSWFEASDLQNLGVGEAICRIEQSSFDFNLKSHPLPSVDRDSDTAEVRRNWIRTFSRKHYARKRRDIEAMLYQEMAGLLNDEPTAGIVDAKPEPRGKSFPETEISPARESTPEHGKTAEPEQQDRLQAATPEPLVGHGGPQHKYLQNLIKKVAQDRGYLTTIEYPIFEGAGRVDVALEKNGKKFACEISVTSTPEYEFGNVEKCLAAGFDPVIVLTSDSKQLRKMKEYISSRVAEPDVEKVRVLLPDAFISYLDEEEADFAGQETTVRGYKVKVKYSAVDQEERKRRREAIAKVIVQSMKRMEKSKR